MMIAPDSTRRVSLGMGADDFGSAMREENVGSSAGHAPVETPQTDRSSKLKSQTKAIVCQVEA